MENNVPQCSVITFSWDKQNPTPSNSRLLPTDYIALAQATPYDISNHIHSVSFSKDLGAPAGSFHVVLDNSRDWKEIVKPGEWCLIFMTQDGDLPRPNESLKGPKGLPIFNPGQFPLIKKRLRGLCYIDRVAVKSSVQENGENEIYFELVGRDFGAVYEQTEIWKNRFGTEAIQIDALQSHLNSAITKDLSGLLGQIHNLIFDPTSEIALIQENSALTEVGPQWLMPMTMAGGLFQFGGSGTFFANIKDVVNFEPTYCTLPISDPIKTIMGNAWTILKTHSIEELHELFCELDDSGNPKLTFRPIPWKLSPMGYPGIQSKIKFYAQLLDGAVRVTNVTDRDLGYDNHARFNHFLVSASFAGMAGVDSISILANSISFAGRKFPYADKPNIVRHGFRPMHIDINTLLQDIRDPKNGTPDPLLLTQVCEVVFDYWRNAFQFESGTIVQEGQNETRIGKGAFFDSEDALDSNKLFYIEGYTDEFIIDENGAPSWTQTLQLTRGIEIGNIPKLTTGGSDISKRVTPYKVAGDFNGGTF